MRMQAPTACTCCSSPVRPQRTASGSRCSLNWLTSLRCHVARPQRLRLRMEKTSRANALQVLATAAWSCSSIPETASHLAHSLADAHKPVVSSIGTTEHSRLHKNLKNLFQRYGVAQIAARLATVPICAALTLLFGVSVLFNVQQEPSGLVNLSNVPILQNLITRIPPVHPTLALMAQAGSYVLGGIPTAVELCYEVTDWDINPGYVFAMAGIVANLRYGWPAWALAVLVLLRIGVVLRQILGVQPQLDFDMLLRNTPKHARVLTKGVKGQLLVNTWTAADVPVGSLVLVNPGDTVPLDGEIVYGKTNVTDSTANDRPVSRPKNKGQKILAGAINHDGVIVVRTSRIAADTEAARYAQLADSKKVFALSMGAGYMFTNHIFPNGEISVSQGS